MAREPTALIGNDDDNNSNNNVDDSNFKLDLKLPMVTIKRGQPHASGDCTSRTMFSCQTTALKITSNTTTTHGDV